MVIDDVHGRCDGVAIVLLVASQAHLEYKSTLFFILVHLIWITDTTDVEVASIIVAAME
jgi:hypothetical protein